MTKSVLPADFGEFYKQHYRSVYRVCYTWMRNPADAEDCTEDTFVRMIDASPDFQSDDHARAWLTVTAMNLCKDRLKHWWHKKVVPMEAYSETLVQDPPEPDLTLDAVRSLSQKYREVIYLYYYEGYQTDEIAGLLKRPSSTVRNQLRDARKKLKKLLGDDFL